MDQVKLWRLARTPSGSPVAEAVSSTPQTETEKLLEDVLIASPDLLLEGLRIIGRQCETAGGTLDILGLDDEGRLVVFELKRGVLRREAVAQAVDYASFLSELTLDQLIYFVDENWRNFAKGKTESFSEFYSQTFGKSVADIGKPKIVLVGVGADAATKRMVNFLVQGGLDISFVTFHAFSEEGKTYLAKQVETRATSSDPAVSRNGKAMNQAILSAALRDMGIDFPFESVAKNFRQAFGPNCYQWPYEKGYSFSRPETDSEGIRKRRTLVTLLIDSAHTNQFQIILQPKSVDNAGITAVKEAAISMGSSANPKPTGYVSFWVNAQHTGLVEACRRLAVAIANGGASPSEEFIADETIEPDLSEMSE